MSDRLASQGGVLKLTKIMYITDGISPWVVGGMQTVSRRHIGWLHELGYEVLAVTSRSKPDDGVEFASKVAYLEWPRSASWQKLNPHNYANQLRKFSSRVSPLIDEFKPNLVYSEGPLIASYLKRPRHMRVSTVFHPHGLEMYQQTGSWITDVRLRPLRGLVRNHVLRVDKTLSQGGRLDQILREQVGADEDSIENLPNCTPAGFRFACGARENQGGRFLFVGRNEVRKGLRPLIKEVTRVSNSQLEIVGGGKKFPRLPGRFILHGEITDRERLREIYEQVDFLVVPSLAEGMPTVILEAFAAGLPVIAADVGAIAGLVKDNENGFLIPRADPTALRQALIKAISLSDSDYRAFSASALDSASNAFSPAIVRSKFDRIIRSLISNPNTRFELD